MDETAVPLGLSPLGDSATTRAGSCDDGAVLEALTAEIVPALPMATVPLERDASVPDEIEPIVVMVPPVTDDTATVPRVRAVLGDMATTREGSVEDAAVLDALTAAMVPALPMATVPLDKDASVPDETTTVPLLNEARVPPRIVTEPLVRLVMVPPVRDAETVNARELFWIVIAFAAGVPATAATALTVMTVPVVVTAKTPEA